jgi:hypothetical protein
MLAQMISDIYTGRYDPTSNASGRPEGYPIKSAKMLDSLPGVIELSNGWRTEHRRLAKTNT